MFQTSKARIAFLFFFTLLVVGAPLIQLVHTESASAVTPRTESKFIVQPAVKSSPLTSFAVPALPTVIRPAACPGDAGCPTDAGTGADGDGASVTDYMDCVMEGPSTTQRLIGILGGPGGGDLINATACAGDEAFKEFQASVFGKMEKWIRTQMANAVSWGMNGVMSLALGIRSECMIQGGSGASGAGNHGWDDSGTDTGGKSEGASCENRINMDYFTPGEAQLAQTNDFNQQMNAAKTNLQAQINAAGTDEEKAALTLDMADLNAAATAGPGGGSMMYSPVSPLSYAEYDREYLKMAIIGISLMVPMVIAAIIHSVVTLQPKHMLKGIFIHLPAALFGITVAPWFTKQVMVIVDGLSSYVASDVKNDIAKILSGFMPSVLLAGMGQVSLLALLLVGLMFVICSIMVWMILNLRTAGIALTLVYFPIAFGASVWPAMSKWSERIIKLLVAAVISKIFIVGALSLGIAIMSHTDTAGGFSLQQLVFGSTIFGIAAFSPSVVMKTFDSLGESIHQNNNGVGGMAKVGTVAGLSANGGAMAKQASAGTKQLSKKISGLMK